MAIRVANTGSGGKRPLVIAYHAGGDALRAVWPEATIVSQAYPGFADHYTHFGPDAIATIDEVLAAAGMIADDMSALVLVGFSEGCQGVRTQLLAGVVPSAALAVDGIHAQPDPWRAYAERARRGEVALTITHSSIQPTYASTTQMAATIMAPDVEQPVAPSGGQYPQISEFQDGLFRVVGYAGTDAGAHVYQGTVVLPAELARIRDANLSMPSSSGGGLSNMALLIGGAVAGFAVVYNLRSGT